MELKKGLVIGILLVLIFLVLLNLISALGASPAKKEYNFKPGLETSIKYVAFSTNNRDLMLSVEGNLSEYVTLDKTSLPEKGGVFTAHLKLPNSIEIPGKHRILVKVSEAVDPEISGFIGTSIAINLVIDIYVPYPGQYLDIELSAPDVNVKEPVNFLLKVISQGKERVNITPEISIYDSEGSKVEELIFINRIIQSQETLNLKKALDTINYNPGTYTAKAVVDYGALAKSEASFRIGELVVDVLRYSKEIFIEETSRFDVEIQSGWNDKISGAYAEISMINQSRDIISTFKTSPTDLIPWQTKTITGYFDSSEFKPGIYIANITMTYYGHDQAKTSNAVVEVEFIKPQSTLIWYILGGAGLLIILASLIIKYFKKHGKQKKKN